MSNISDILIVEDSLTQALQLQNCLENNGFNSIIVNNGIKGIEILKKQDISMVISDIVMPKMDGYELCRRIKSDDDLKTIPVILLTSLSDPQDVIEALACGADNFVTKPYNEKFLISRMNNIIINQELRKDKSDEGGLEIIFANNKHVINSNRTQIVDLLFSTYENAILKNLELERVNRELVVAQRELEQKNIELGKLNEQKNHFLGMAAHDLRNPLGAIYNSSELMLEGLLGDFIDEQLEIIQNIKDSSDFMLQMVNEFLDISQIESGKLTLNLQDTNIIELIRKNLDFNTLFAQKKQIRLNFNSKMYSSIPEMKIDAPKIQQVLNNLISNAIKFSYPGGKVDIGLKLDNNHILISVKDQGQGIPLNEQDKLFNPFQQTSVKSTAGEKSTGLGLTIAKKIILEHKGNIWVKSEVGKGSIFYIQLPHDFNEKQIKKIEPILFDISNDETVRSETISIDFSDNMTKNSELKPVDSSNNETELKNIDTSDNSTLKSDFELIDSSNNETDPKTIDTSDNTTLKPDFELNDSSDNTTGEMEQKPHDSFDNQTFYENKSRKRLSILLVDDNITSQKIMVKILEKLNCLTQTASNGDEAIKLMEKDFFDIVVLDIDMPVMDGIKTTKIIRDKSSKVLNHDIKIIALISHSDDPNINILLKEGFDGYLTKPIYKDALDNIIKKYTQDIKKSYNNKSGNDKSGKLLKDQNNQEDKKQKLEKEENLINKDVFDQNVLLQQIGNDTDLYNKLIKKYKKKLPKNIEKLEKAISEKNIEKIKTLNISIQSESVTIGSKSAYEATQKFQSSIIEKDFEKIKSNFNSLKNEINKLVQILIKLNS